MITTVTSSGLETSYSRLKGERDAGSFVAAFEGGAGVDFEDVVGGGGAGVGRDRVRSCRRGVGVAKRAERESQSQND